MFSPLEQFIAIISFRHFVYITANYLPVFPHVYFSSFGYVLDFSFLHFFLPLLLIRFIFTFILINSFDMLYLIPRYFLQKILELHLEFIFNLIKQQLGKNYYRFYGMIFSIFYGIFFLNLLSLMPLGVALTSHIFMVLSLSLSLGLGIFLIGLNKHEIEFFWFFLPKCPTFMIPLLIIIEIFSYIIRTFSLAIRLGANIMAGHTLVYIISTFILSILSTDYIILFLSFHLLLLIWILELGVAFLQAYVFTILILIYLNDSLKKLHH